MQEFYARWAIRNRLHQLAASKSLPAPQSMGPTQPAKLVPEQADGLVPSVSRLQRKTSYSALSAKRWFKPLDQPLEAYQI